jgi:hypothetical protein
MVISQISTEKFISDTVLFIRDLLKANVMDPIEDERAKDEKFIFTSYPQRQVKYPVVSVRKTNISTSSRLGFQSNHQLLNIPLEIRVWARNEKENDIITQDVVNALRSQEYVATGTINAKLFNFQIENMVLVPEDGEAGTKGTEINIRYDFILGE